LNITTGTWRTNKNQMATDIDTTKLKSDLESITSQLERISAIATAVNTLKANHSGQFRYHDDDCWCATYCNRGGDAWSCCGACVKDTYCAKPFGVHHYTHWGISGGKFYRVNSHKDILTPEEAKKL
jgi:hypothetical protein